MTTYTDIFELSRTRGHIEGRLTRDDLPEALSMLEGEAADVTVDWSAHGTAGSRDLPGADLTISARVVTDCARCGKPVELAIDKTVSFLFTRTEAQADAMPIDEDGDFEIVVGSRKFDVAHWVEEELILSLPPVARHDDCAPEARDLETHEEDEPQKPNPFACLAGLKTRH